MVNSLERVLVVENDPEIWDLIARQALQPLGYQVQMAADASLALQEISRLNPDLVIANLNLPGLSGKDLLVALNAKGNEVPVIVMADKGMENAIIQAFRLGAADYLLWPMRETEVVAAVERVLRHGRARHERETLSNQLKRTNEELRQRVRELTTIYAIGKAVTSTTDAHSLFEKIVEGAAYVTEADCGWLLLREDKDAPFLLGAQRNLPGKLGNKLGQPWDDGISSLVALSGEPLSIHGDPLSRFKVWAVGKSALVVPVKVKKEVVGILVVMRREDRPFTLSNQTLMEAVADYASISLMNTRLFRALEDRARLMQAAAEKAKANEQRKDQALKRLQQELDKPVKNALQSLEAVMAQESLRLDPTHRQALRSADDKLKKVAEIAESLNNLLEKP